MKVRWLFVVIIGFVLAVSASAQERRPDANAKPSGGVAFGPLGALPSDSKVILTPAQQKPILLLLRDRELLNAKIEGAVEVLMAFLDLSPAEWDCVATDEGITFVRRKPAVQPEEKEKK